MSNENNFENGQYDAASFDSILKDIENLDNLQASMNQGAEASTCKITLKRPGKTSVSMTVAVGTKLNDVLAQSGWSGLNQLTFSRRVNEDEMELIGDVNHVTLGEGDHVIFAAPKVEGGC